MGFKRELRWLILLLMPLFIFTGCGDLEPDMQDTRTVILNMDFHKRSSSRSISSVSASELSQYNSHLILAVPSLEYLTSSYRNYYSSFAQGLMNTADKNVSLEIPLNTQMKIFAFLFRDTYSLYDLISGYQEVGYYGESDNFSIGTQTNNLSLGITLNAASANEDASTGGGDDSGNDGGSGDYSNTDTTAPVIETVTAVTTPTSNSTPDYTFSSTESGSITYGGPCATAGSATTNAIVGHNLIIFNTLSDGSYINCTITVTDPAGNESTTLHIPDFTVQTISTLPAPDNLSASGTSTSVTLKWNAVTDASSYTLYWDNVSGIDSSDNAFNNITNDNYTHNNLDNGTTYYYKVAAVNSSGTGTLSSEKIYITNLWDGMVAHYSFNGNANNVKANYNGTVSGATMSTGRGNDNNTAYSFDGVDDYIDFGSGILSGNGSFTIVVSINSTTTSSRILQQRDDQGFNGQYMLDILDNGSIKFNTYYNGFKWNVTSSSALNDGSWHHLAFVQKDNGGQMYLNGILEQTDNTGGKVNLTSSLKTYIGGDLRNYNSFYSGKVDDLRIYSRALSVSEIQTLHNIID